IVAWLIRISRPVLPAAVILWREELGEVGLDGEAGSEGVGGSVGGDLRGVEVELLAPDQTGPDALLDDRREEVAEALQSVALPDPAQTGVVRERLGQIVADIPAQAEAVGDDLQELTFGTQPFEEEDELQLEEDHRVDRGATRLGIG